MDSFSIVLNSNNYWLTIFALQAEVLILNLKRVLPLIFRAAQLQYHIFLKIIMHHQIIISVHVTQIGQSNVFYL